jgi:hypothetical protein
MKRILGIAVLCLVSGCASSGLIEMSVSETPTGTRKPLDITFREIGRNESDSIVEVGYVSGASVPSSMFVLKGVCKVARARGAKYFNSSQVFGSFDGKTRYRITFHASADEEVEVDDDPYGLSKRKGRPISASACLLVPFL